MVAVVLTYAVKSIPLHRLAEVTMPEAAAGVLAVLTRAAFGLLMFRMFARLAGGYYGAVVTTAFVAVTTGWGPIAMAFLRRPTDEQGRVEPMPAILPFNAFHFFPWMVILLTRLVFAVAGWIG